MGRCLQQNIFKGKKYWLRKACVLWCSKEIKQACRFFFRKIPLVFRGEPEVTTDLWFESLVEFCRGLSLSCIGFLQGRVVKDVFLPCSLLSPIVYLPTDVAWSDGAEQKCWYLVCVQPVFFFSHVISLGSKKPMELCFFRDRWVRLPAEKERLPVCFFFLFFDSLGKKNAFIGEPFKNNHQSPYLSLFLSPRADLIKSSFKIYSLLL